jgi:hypothetical protein
MLARVNWELACPLLPRWLALPREVRLALLLVGSREEGRLPREHQVALADAGLLRRGSGLHLATGVESLLGLLRTAAVAETYQDPTTAGSLALAGEVVGAHLPAIRTRFAAMGIRWHRDDEVLAAASSGELARLAAEAAVWGWSDLAGINLTLVSHEHLAAHRRSGQALLSWIVAQPQAPTWEAAVAHCPDPAHLPLVLRWATQCLVLIPQLAVQDGVLRLGLPRAWYAHRNRPAPTRPSPSPGVVGEHAWRLDDLVAVCAALGAKPARINKDWTLGVRDLRALAALLPVADARLVPVLDPEPRASEAISVGQRLELLTTDGRQRRLALTAAGRRWLAQPRDERRRLILDRLRAACQGEIDLRRYDGQSGGGTYPRRLDARHPEPWRLLHDALRDLDETTWTLARALPWWSRTLQPHASPADERAVGLLCQQLVLDVAVAYGAVAVGEAPGGGLLLRLTAAGRYVCGLDAAYAPAPDLAPVRPLIVQADHTIAFLAPAPALEAEIGRFAERLPGASGVGVLFRLTREAVQAGAIAGISGEDALRILIDATAKPLPDNVTHELRSWFGSVRRASAALRLVVTCPDEATAARIVESARPDAERLGPLLVGLPSDLDPLVLARRLAKTGIALAVGLDEDEDG